MDVPKNTKFLFFFFLFATIGLIYGPTAQLREISEDIFNILILQSVL